MAEPISINPNIGNQAEAMAGAQSITFTATDRKLILERSGGEIDKTKSFKEVFAKKPLAEKVENDLTTVEQGMDVTEVAGRLKEHQKLLKNSPVAAQRDKPDITDAGVDQVESGAEEAAKAKEQAEGFVKEHSRDDVYAREPAAPAPQLRPETLAIARELNLDASQLFDKFELEQKELHALILKIRDLHLKRLLSASQRDFAALSDEIEKETLASARPAAQVWFRQQLKALKRSAAEYKLNLVKSLRSMHIDEKNERDLKWLNQVIAQCS